MIAFPISKVNALRNRAAKACPEPDGTIDGWSKSEADPMRLLAVFESLRIKPGFVLRAYQFLKGGNGNGVVWAMPSNAPFPEAKDCPQLDGHFLSPPKPPLALDDLMEAVDGDGTPWSYLSASVFVREASEFGAMWHGCSWSTHAILGADPWQCDPTARDRRKHRPLASGTADEWNWNRPRPELWEPSFEQSGGMISISFLTFSGLGQELIYRWTDTFKAGRSSLETKEEVVAEGPGGFVF